MAACSVCLSSQLPQCNSLLLSGISAAECARACDLPVRAVQRHAANHLPKPPREPVSVMQTLTNMLQRAETLADAARKRNDFRAELAAMREQGRICERIADLQKPANTNSDTLEPGDVRRVPHQPSVFETVFLPKLPAKVQAEFAERKRALAEYASKPHFAVGVEFAGTGRRLTDEEASAHMAAIKREQSKRDRELARK